MDPNRKAALEAHAKEVAHAEWPKLTPGQLNTFAQYATSTWGAKFEGLPVDGELKGIFYGLAISSPWMLRDPPSAARVKSYLLATQPNLKPDERVKLSRDVDLLDPDGRLNALPASNDATLDAQERTQSAAVAHAFQATAAETPTDADLTARLLAAVGPEQYHRMTGGARAQYIAYMRLNCVAPPLPQTPVAAEMLARGIKDPTLLHPRDRLALAREQQSSARAAAAAANK